MAMVLQGTQAHVATELRVEWTVDGLAGKHVCMTCP